MCLEGGYISRPSSCEGSVSRSPGSDISRIGGFFTALLASVELEGTPTELCNTLGDINLAAVPERPDELTKKLKAISRTSQIFTVSQHRRRVEGEVTRRLKLERGERPDSEPSNGVHLATAFTPYITTSFAPGM